MVIALFDAIAYRDLVEIRGWAEELAGAIRPLVDAPARGRRAGHGRGGGLPPRGLRAERTGSAARGSNARPTRRRRGTACLPLAVAALARGAYAEVVERCIAAAERGIRVDETLVAAALATAYAGDLDRARELNARGHADAVSPTMRAWSEYVAGEIESVAGHAEAAEQHYRRRHRPGPRLAARPSWSASRPSGLLSPCTSPPAGSAEALHGYRDVIDYFARTGNWTHLWATLRNLADLLRRIGDPDPAAVLDAAADHAPDAPAVDRGERQPEPPTAAVSRDEVLRIARDADRAEPQSVTDPTTDPLGAGGMRAASTYDSSPTQAV